MNKDIDPNKVRVFTDHAYQSNTCKKCGHETLGTTPDRCSKCGANFCKGMDYKIRCNGCGKEDFIGNFRHDDSIGTDPISGRDIPDFLCDACWVKRGFSLEETSIPYNWRRND